MKIILNDCVLLVENTTFIENHANLLKISSDWKRENFIEMGLSRNEWNKLIESILIDETLETDLSLDFIIYLWNHPDNQKATTWIDLNVEDLESFIDKIVAYFKFFVDVYPIEKLAKILVIINRLLRRYDFVMETKTIGKSYSTYQAPNLLGNLVSFVGENLEWVLKVVFLVASSISDTGGIILAGGSLIKCLNKHFDSATINSHSDLDLWIYGENEETRKEIFDMILNIIVHRHKKDIALKFDSHYVTIIHKSKDTRPIQLILTNYQYPYQITDSFDYPYLGAYYDGSKVFMNFECQLALQSSLIDIPVENLWVKRLKKSLDYKLISNSQPVWKEIVNVLNEKKKLNIFKVIAREETINIDKKMKLLSDLKILDKVESKEDVIVLLSDENIDDLNSLREAITNKKTRMKFVDFIFDGDLTDKGKFNYKGYERYGYNGNYVVATAEDHVHISMNDPMLLLNHSLKSIITSRKIETVTGMRNAIILSPSISIRLTNVTIIVKQTIIIFNFKQNDDYSNRIIRKVDKKLKTLHHVINQMIDVDKRFPAKPLISHKNYFVMFNPFKDLKPGKYKVNLDLNIEGWDIYGYDAKHTLAKAITKIEIL